MLTEASYTKLMELLCLVPQTYLQALDTATCGEARLRALVHSQVVRVQFPLPLEESEHWLRQQTTRSDFAANTDTSAIGSLHSQKML